MFEQLRKQSAKSAMSRLLLCIAIIIIVLLGTHNSLRKLYEGPKHMDSLATEELPNSYVSADVYAILGNFAQYYETDEDGTETITSKYFIIPVGEKEYIGLQIKSKDYLLAEQIYNETYDYMVGNRDDLTTTMSIKGTINKMDDDVYLYYMEWFAEAGYMEEMNDIALPYILQVDYIGGDDEFIVFAAIFVIGVSLFVTIFISIKLLVGAYVSDIKKFLRKNDSYISEERLEADYLSATQIESIRVGKRCFYYFKGSKAKILANKEIVWAYLENVTQRVYGIKTGVSKYLIVYTKDKKMYRIPMKKVDDVKAVLQLFSQQQPHIVIGYSEELKRCFKNDFNTFLHLNSQVTDGYNIQY